MSSEAKFLICLIVTIRTQSPNYSCCSDLGSLTGQNLNYLLQKYNKDSIADLMLDKNTLKKARVYQLSENEHWKTNIIEELSLI